MASLKSRIVAIKIYDDHLLDQIGFDDCNPQSNGEYHLLDKIIQSDDFVLDIGANCGEWSKRALAKGAEVIAFEPVEQEFEELKKIDNQKFKSYQIALSDKDSTQTFYVCTKPLERGGSSFFRNNAHWNKISVPTRSLDSFMEEHKINHIDFAKIDTEGAEADILYGSRCTLTNQNISCVQFEYGGTYPDANKTLREVYEYLTGLNYKVYRVVSDGLIHISRWHNELENSLYSNYVACASNIELATY